MSSAESSNVVTAATITAHAVTVPVAIFKAAVAATTTVAFDAKHTVLTIDAPATFKGIIADFGKGDAIFVAGFDKNTVLTYSAAKTPSTYGTLTLTDGKVHDTLSIAGSYKLADFSSSFTAKGGFEISYHGVKI